MAKVFLDTNKLFDYLEREPESLVDIVGSHEVYILALSVHIFCYVYKRTMPDNQLTELLKNFHILGIDQTITHKSLLGPTSDMEDNLQLHTAVTGACDIFITRDQKLLQLKYFGKMEIREEL